MVKLRPDGSSGNVHYDYKCCKLEMNDPTQAPIASPTLVPVAEPTHVPVANPTKAPTLEPTANPTENAPLFCPLEVNNDFKGILKNLKEGCASVAEDDIGWDQIKDGSRAMIICTNQQVSSLSTFSTLSLTSLFPFSLSLSPPFSLARSLSFLRSR